MSVRISRHGRVNCRAMLDIPLGATSVWGQIRDFHRYARQDFFHAELTVKGGIPRAGAKLALCHRYAGLRIDRVGKILIWREGVGYSYSDLSARGPRGGFPHVFSYRVEPTGEKTSHLHIRVAGRWTTRWVPRPVARLWLAWVFGQIVRNVRIKLMVYQIWRARNLKRHRSTGVVP